MENFSKIMGIPVPKITMNDTVDIIRSVPDSSSGHYFLKRTAELYNYE
ncbi:hypothetical protein [Paenibacillus piri]|nr:hypothetical protein [Paenibacillus piri]